MTLHEWRSNSERRSMALDVLAQPALREMLQIMELVEHPARQQRPLGDGFGATLAYGEIKGFQLALDMLRSFTEPLPAPVEDVETTWGIPNINQT